jgi:hypothetical protein
MNLAVPFSILSLKFPIVELSITVKQCPVSERNLPIIPVERVKILTRHEIEEVLLHNSRSWTDIIRDRGDIIRDRGR